MSNDRRTNFRVPLNLPAKYEGLSGAYEARIEDMSLSGCFVNARGQVNEGDTISVEVKLPSGEWLKLPGQVTALHPGIGFGMVFSPLTSSQKYALEKLLIG